MDASGGFGAGAQLLGGTLQMIAAKRAQAELAKTFAREQERQTAHQTQAFGSFNQFLPSQGVEAARDALKAGAAQRLDQFQQAGEQRFSTGKDTRTAQDKSSYALTSNARANLGAYSDWQLSSAIKRIRQQDNLNRISYMAQQDASVFPYRMFDAQHSQDNLAAIGGLIASLGGSAANFGALGQAPQGGQFSGGGGGVQSPGSFLDAPQGFGQDFSNLS